MCRSHAFEVLASNEGDGPVPDWVHFGIDMLDRQMSQSGDSLVSSIRERLGGFISDLANDSEARENATAYASRAAAEAQAKWQQRKQRQEEAKQGYAQAPPPPRQPPQSGPNKEDPRVILGFPVGSAPSKDEIKARQRDLAQFFHPDKGGSVEAMQKVNAAAAQLIGSL